MTPLLTRPTVARPQPELVTREVPAPRAEWIEAATSADHKAVAKLWMGTALTFLAAAVVEFALTRVQLIVPDSTIIVPEVFNRILSASIVSGVVLFAVPLLLGVIGYVVPLQIGARGVALPRLNQVAYWLYAAGAFLIYASFLYDRPRDGALRPAAALRRRLLPAARGRRLDRRRRRWRPSASSASRST